MDPARVLRFATRGSALALAQADEVLSAATRARPGLRVERVVIRTTGDARPDLDLGAPGAGVPAGLFTSEIQAALQRGEADIAVHSLKDLPTGSPEGLRLAATLPRADPREVLLYRDAARVEARRQPLAEWRPGSRELRGFPPGLTLRRLPAGARLATSSTRRRAQFLAVRPDLDVVPIRGNVPTRLQHLQEDASFDVLLLAAAGLVRLGWQLGPRSRLIVDPRNPSATPVEPPPEGLLGTLLEAEDFIPAVGQGALGLEIRADDADAAGVCAALNHLNTWLCITAERSFLQAIGGGCHSAAGANARRLGHQLELRAWWQVDGQVRQGVARRPAAEAERLGRELARQLT
ncbi:MAG: hydroxymethylbilane synthase [Verrucomicrobiota bacterium]